MAVEDQRKALKGQRKAVEDQPKAVKGQRKALKDRRNIAKGQQKGTTLSKYTSMRTCMG